MHSVNEVCASARERPPTKELLIIIPMHMMNRVNLWQETGFDGVLYKLRPLPDEQHQGISRTDVRVKADRCG